MLQSCFPKLCFLYCIFPFRCEILNIDIFVSLSDMKLSKMNRMFSYWPSYFKSLAVNDISTRCGFFPIFKFDLLEAADSEFQELEEWKLSLHSYFYLFTLKNCHLFLFWFIFSNSHILSFYGQYCDIDWLCDFNWKMCIVTERKILVKKKHTWLIHIMVCGITRLCVLREVIYLFIVFLRQNSNQWGSSFFTLCFQHSSWRYFF